MYLRQKFTSKKEGENKDYLWARSQWLRPVILATQEAEIRRIMVPSQPQANRDPILKKKNLSHKRGWWSGSNGKSACLAIMRP
jgi:hypothetical protein